MIHIHGTIRLLIVLALLSPCCCQGSNQTIRVQGDLAIFLNGKLLDPQETSLITLEHYYVPTLPAPLPFRNPVYLEYDGAQVFRIDPDGLQKEVDRRITEIEAQATNSVELYTRLGQAAFTSEYYTIDLTYSVLGQYGLVPVEGRTGCRVAGNEPDGTSACLRELLDGINRDTQGVVLCIRGSEPMRVGLILRALRKRRIDTTVEYYDDNDVLKFSIRRRNTSVQPAYVAPAAGAASARP